MDESNVKVIDYTRYRLTKEQKNNIAKIYKLEEEQFEKNPGMGVNCFITRHGYKLDLFILKSLDEDNTIIVMEEGKYATADRS